MLVCEIVSNLQFWKEFNFSKGLCLAMKGFMFVVMFSAYSCIMSGVVEFILTLSLTRPIGLTGTTLALA